MLRVLCCLCFFVGVFCHAEEQRCLQIVGCGGSGTTYTSQCLQSAGLNVRHEYVGSYGYVGWPFVAGFYNCWGNRILGARFKHTFHQVRNPLKVISTWLKLSDLNRVEWRFIRRTIENIRVTDSAIIQCAKYWYYWNKKAEAMSEWRYQIEAFDDVIGEFESRLGVCLDRELMETVPKNTNSWQGDSCPVTWAFLEEQLPLDLYQDIQEMAKRYGYSITDG